MNNIALYDCFNAKVGTQGVSKSNFIYCEKGHSLHGNNKRLNYDRLMRGDPLRFNACQNCTDFDGFGDFVSDLDKGWVGKRVYTGTAESILKKGER